MGVILWFWPGQVDWAALAQAWIAQKESTGAEQQTIQPNGQDIPGLEPVGQSNHGAFQGEPAFGRMWQPGTPLALLNHNVFFFVFWTPAKNPLRFLMDWINFFKFWLLSFFLIIHMDLAFGHKTFGTLQPALYIIWTVLANAPCLSCLIILNETSRNIIVSLQHGQPSFWDRWIPF